MLRFPIAGVTLLIALIEGGIDDDDEGIRDWMIVEERGLAPRALIVVGEAVTNEDG